MNLEEERLEEASFCHRAVIRGLLWDSPGTQSRYHIFNLSAGNFYAPPKADKVKQLVEFAPSTQRKELLDLVANRDQVKEFNTGRLECLHWFRWYYVEGSKNPSQWMMLSQWLAERELTNLWLAWCVTLVEHHNYAVQLSVGKASIESMKLAIKKLLQENDDQLWICHPILIDFYGHPHFFAMRGVELIQLLWVAANRGIKTCSSYGKESAQFVKWMMKRPLVKNFTTTLKGASFLPLREIQDKFLYSLQHELLAELPTNQLIYHKWWHWLVAGMRKLRFWS